MHDKSTTISANRLVWLSSVPVFRYSLGATLILIVALAMDYTMAFLTPVLALSFMAPGVKPLSLRAGLGFLLVLGCSNLVAIMFSNYFLSYPVVFVLLLGTLLFQIFYTNKIKPGIKVWLLISLLLLPLLSTYTKSMGSVVAISIMISATIAVLLVWLVFFFFPDSSEVPIAAPKSAPKLSQKARSIMALDQLIVVFPVVVSFYVFQWSGAILVLIFIVLLSMNPAARNPKLGASMILANFAGGLASIVVYNLLTVVPEMVFLALLVLLFGLIFGQKLFSGKPAAPLYGMAFSTFILVLGSVTSSDGDAGEKVWERLFQISTAVIYIVVAFKILNYYTKTRRADAQVK